MLGWEKKDYTASLKNAVRKKKFNWPRQNERDYIAPLESV